MNFALSLLLSVVLLSVITTNSLTLTEVGTIRTEGGAGFEHFETIGGKHYLASANFWNGVHGKMGAESSVHAIERRGDSGQLFFPVVQNMTSWGGHGVDHFTVQVLTESVQEQGEKGEQEGEVGEWVDVLVVPSYYGCERGDTDTCSATHIYYNWDPIALRFVDSLPLISSGPSQSDHFTRGGVTYLLLAENFVSQLSVYRLSASSALSSKTEKPLLQAEKIQSISVAGIAACATALIESTVYVIAASYHDAGWQTQSPVYKWDETAQTFTLLQTLSTTGAHDAETIEFQMNHFLVFSEDRNKDSVRISSNLYKWSPDSQRYRHMQAIATDGAHAAEFFIMQQQLFLAIANFGDRHNRRYDAESAVYQYAAVAMNSEVKGNQCVAAEVATTSAAAATTAAGVVEEDIVTDAFDGHDELECTSQGGSLFQFQLQATVPTMGATDWEYFELDSPVEHARSWRSMHARRASASTEDDERSDSDTSGSYSDSDSESDGGEEKEKDDEDDSIRHVHRAEEREQQQQKKHSFLAVSEEADMKRGASSPFWSRVYRVQV